MMDDGPEVQNPLPSLMKLMPINGGTTYLLDGFPWSRSLFDVVTVMGCFGTRLLW